MQHIEYWKCLYLLASHLLHRGTVWIFDLTYSVQWSCWLHGFRPCVPYWLYIIYVAYKQHGSIFIRHFLKHACLFILHWLQTIIKLYLSLLCYTEWIMLSVVADWCHRRLVLSTGSIPHCLIAFSLPSTSSSLMFVNVSLVLRVKNDGIKNSVIKCSKNTIFVMGIY